MYSLTYGVQQTDGQTDRKSDIHRWVPHLKKLLKKLYDPFYGWGSTASRLEPLQGGSLLFTTKFTEIPCTHFVDLRRMKA